MFHSINAYTGETLCRRPAQGYAEFAQELAALKLRQQAFARLGVTGRTALLQAFAEHLAHVLDRENVPYQPQALQLLGRAAAGSMRDALSLLD